MDDLRISIQELRKRLDQGEAAVFVDTRNPQAWAESDVKIPGAIRVPADELGSHLDRIPTGALIVTYCT